MKKVSIMIVSLMGIFAASCSNERVDMVENAQVEKPLAPVEVYVSGFFVSQEACYGTRTRAVQNVADYNGVKAVTLAFYDGETEVYKTTQLKDDATTFTTFGSFSLSLPLGSYTMVVLGYGLYDDDEFTLTSPTQAGFTGDLTGSIYPTEAGLTGSFSVNSSWLDEGDITF